MAKILLLLTRYLYVIIICFIQQYVVAQETDTLQFFYPVNSSSINLNQSKHLDSLAKKLKVTPSSSLSIYGFTDYVGDSISNYNLSTRRANSIKNYLINKAKISLDQINESLGKGEINNNTLINPKGNSSDRKVQIIVYNDKVTIDTSFFYNGQIGDKINIKQIQFKPGTPILREEAIPVLIGLINILKDLPNLRVEIRGHICCISKESYNIKYKYYNLSEQRAKTVYDFLVNNNIDFSRLKYKGVGISDPLVVPEVTEKDRISNRRVSIVILDK